MELSPTVISIAAWVAGIMSLGYRILFINKSSKAPNPKEKFKKETESIENNGNVTNNKGIPNFNDNQSIKEYFYQEIQLGEELIDRGELESGASHLVNAMIVCGQRTRFLEVLEKYLSGEAYEVVMSKANEAYKHRRLSTLF